MKIKHYIKEIGYNQNVAGLKEKLKACDYYINFYGNLGDLETDGNNERAQYWKDYKKFVQDFIDGKMSLNDVVKTYRLNDNIGLRDAAMFIKNLLYLDMTGNVDWLENTKSTINNINNINKDINMSIKKISRQQYSKIYKEQRIKLSVGDIVENSNGDTCEIVAISYYYPDVKEYDTTYDGKDFWKLKKGKDSEYIYVAARNLNDGDYYVYPTSTTSRILGESVKSNKLVTNIKKLKEVHINYNKFSELSKKLMKKYGFQELSHEEWYKGDMVITKGTDEYYLDYGVEWLGGGEYDNSDAGMRPFDTIIDLLKFSKTASRYQ